MSNQIDQASLRLRALAAHPSSRSKISKSPAIYAWPAVGWQRRVTLRPRSDVDFY